MSKTNFVYALLGTIIGIIIGSLIVSLAPPRPVAAAQPVAAPAIQQQQAASGTLPEGHPPIDDPNLQLALAQQQAILQKDPQNQQAVIAAANLLFDMKNYQAAVSYYEKALQKDESNINLLTDLGTSYFYASNPQKALQIYDRSLTIDPKHAQTLMNVGVVKASIGDKKGAAEAWEKLVALHPEIQEAAELKAMVQKLRAEKLRLTAKSAKGRNLLLLCALCGSVFVYGMVLPSAFSI